MNRRKFVLYTDKTGVLIVKLDSLKELCNYLGRTRLSVEGSLWRIEKGYLTRIKSKTGEYYKIEII